MCADVVRAYKGVLKEKEALEATVKALSVAQVKDADSALTEGACPSDNELDNEAEKSDTGDGGRSDCGRSDISEAGDSGAENRGGEKKSLTPLRTHLLPSGTVLCCSDLSYTRVLVDSEGTCKTILYTPCYKSW